MKERIKLIRKNASMTQEEFGNELGVSRIAITTYETGRVVPDKTVCMLICQKFNVSPDWLSDGIGEMRPSRPFVHELLKVLQKNPALKTVLESMVDEMDADDWSALNNIARKFVEQKQK